VRRQVTSLADNHYRYGCSDRESSGVVDSVARGCWRAAIPGAPSTGVGAKVSMTRLVGAVMSPGQVAEHRMSRGRGHANPPEARPGDDEHGDQHAT